VGASSKFTGSGGAIIGQYQDESMYTSLKETLSHQGIALLKPTIV
jgi:glucuronokinase